MEGDCFGGSNEEAFDITEFAYRIFGNANIKNAYMLVYERKLKNKLKRVVKSEEVKESSLECENTALAREGQVYHNSVKNEYYIFTDFNDVTPQVPPELFKEVWEDNSIFIFERQIYSTEFFNFVLDVVKSVNELVTDIGDEIVTILTRIAMKVILDVLSHAYYNLSMDKIADELIILCKAKEMAVNEFFKCLLGSELKEVMTILTRCPDRFTRVVIAKLISSMLLISINKGKDVFAYEIEQHEEQQVIKYNTNTGKVLHLLISAIDKDLAQNWTRFEQFFLILYNVVKEGGETVLDFMNAQHLLAILLDFYIGNESPLNKLKDRRPAMGNNVDHPKFQYLLDTVCLLIQNADLSFMQSKYLVKGGRELDKDAKECLKSKELYVKSIIEGHNTEAFNKLIVMLCYDSVKFSKMIAKTLLKAINEYSKVAVVPYFSLLTEIFMIKDSLEDLRLEWLFGIPYPCKLKVQNEELKFGLSIIDNIGEDVNDYISPLTYNMKYKSLLTLLWKHRMLYEIYPLKCLLEVTTKNPKVFNYVVSLPPPSYQYAKYSDWVHSAVSFCINSEQQYMKLGLMGESKEKAKANDEVVKLLKNFDEQWEQYAAQHPEIIKQAGILQAFPAPYIIGKVIGEHVLLEETKENATMIISELVTEIYNSLPTGKENKTIPKAYFKKLHEVKIHLDQDNNATKVEETDLQEFVKPLKTETTILQVVVKNSNSSYHSR
jgi:hypothetical protein